MCIIIIYIIVFTSNCFECMEVIQRIREQECELGCVSWRKYLLRCLRTLTVGLSGTSELGVGAVSANSQVSLALQQHMTSAQSLICARDEQAE